MKLHRLQKVLVLCLLSIMIFSSASFASYRIRETNRHYEDGDWITYSSTRFVRHVSVGEQYVYFSTTGGITRYNYFSEKWETPYTISNGLADQNIFITALDFSTGFLWCVRETGISYMEPATHRWFNAFYDEMPVEFDQKAIALGFGNHNVYIMTPDRNIYVTNNTMLAFFKEAGNVQNLDNFTNQNNIEWQWLHDNKRTKLNYMFMDNGYFFNEKDLLIKDLQFREYPITAWAFDRWNKVWLGTWGLGAGKGDVLTQRLEMLNYGLWDQNVDAIYRDHESFWLGGIQEERNAVTLFDPQAQESTFYEEYLFTGFDNAQVTSIASDEDFVWFGTENGLVRHDRDRDNWRTLNSSDNLVDNYVHDVITDGEHVWVATDEGVSYLSRNSSGYYKDKLTHLNYPALRNLVIYDIEQQYNLLWLATEFGIYVHDTISDSGGFYSGSVGPADRATYAVSVFDNQVWFGTDEGISAFDVDKNDWLDPPARLYQTRGNINRIAADKKAVWVATDEGVLKFDRERQYWVQYTMEDGLPSDLVLSLYLDGDYIWFGTDNGLTRFYWNSPYRVD